MRQPFGKRHINKQGLRGLIEFSVARVSEKYINNRMGSQQLCHKISSLKKFRQNLHTKPKKNRKPPPTKNLKNETHKKRKINVN